MRFRNPVTALGIMVLFSSLGSFMIGWRLGWIEFIVVSTAGLVALICALPFVVGGHPLQIDRTVEPVRVQVGNRSTSVLKITNQGKRPSASRVIDDIIGGSRRVVDVPALGAGAQSQAISPLPTEERGIVTVGPAILAKSDPLGLFRRDLGRTPVVQLWVHPRVAALSSIRSGLVKDLEGPTFDNSPAGDVAFHAVREYQRGDDVRHIHWMSTARAGNLMVRHYVDNRRPYLGVLVDADAKHVSPESFERQLEAAASHAVSAALDGRSCAVWVGEQEIMSAREPASRDSALDRLCVSETSDGQPSLVDLYEAMTHTDRGISALILITGDRSAQDLLPVVSRARRSGGVVVVRFVEAGVGSIAIPGAKVIDCIDLEQFASAWRRIVR